jgi:Gpi18-like mannosyltransferase
MKNFFSKHKLITILVLAIVTRLVILGGGLLINNDLAENWVRFDGEWYLDIAKNGYDTNFPLVNPENIACNQGTGLCQRNFAFFPLYPTSINILHNLTGLSYEIAGILISNIAFIGCVLLLYILAKKLFNAKLAFTIAILFAISPLSYIFSALMSESIFAFLLLLTLLLSINKKYLLAGLVGCLLSATRNTGILVIIPMAMIYWKQNRANLNSEKVNFKKPSWMFLNSKMFLSLLMVPLGIIAFAVFLNSRVNDPLAFIHIQSYWEKPVDGVHPLLAIPFSIINYSLEGSLKIHLYNLAWFFGALIIFAIGLKRKLIPFFLNNIVLWLFIPLLAGSMLALPRYLSVLFPIYIIIGKLLVSPLSKMLVFSISFLGLLLLSYFYINGYWITV